jgi:hypothetical protein
MSPKPTKSTAFLTDDPLMHGGQRRWAVWPAAIRSTTNQLPAAIGPLQVCVGYASTLHPFVCLKAGLCRTICRGKRTMAYPPVAMASDAL